MLRGYRTVRAIASVIAHAGEAAMDAYREARVTDEPHITDRLMGAIETAVSASDLARDFRVPDLRDAVADTLGEVDEDDGTEDTADAAASAAGRRLVWQAMTLRAGSGSAAHEKRYGADVLGVLSINTPSYRVSKGFLAQAKRAEPGEPFSKAEWERLQEQCEVMLRTTPDAFAMIFSKTRGVRMVSAAAIASFSGRDVFHLYDLGLRTFFERHIESFIGDRRLDKPKIEVLDHIRSQVPRDVRPSAHVLHLKASLSE
jgi:hypothetical protein